MLSDGGNLTEFLYQVNHKRKLCFDQETQEHVIWVYLLGSKAYMRFNKVAKAVIRHEKGRLVGRNNTEKIKKFDSVLSCVQVGRLWIGTEQGFEIDFKFVKGRRKRAGNCNIWSLLRAESSSFLFGNHRPIYHIFNTILNYFDCFVS